MANIKISELEELTTIADNDVLPIVDVSENETKKIKKENLKIPSINNSKNDSTTATYSCDYINKLNTYSTEEQVIGIWIDGKPIYRRVINSTCPSNSSTWTTISSNLNADEILSYTGYIEFSTSEHKLLANGTSQFTYFQLNKNSNELQIATKDDGFFGKPIKVIIEYTKTTSET